MPKLNFFKIYAGQKEELVRLLAARRIELTGECELSSEESQFALTLYFSSNPRPRDVRWIPQLRRLFNVPQQMRDNYSAVVLIESAAFTDCMYAVCYGTSHHFVSRHSDWEFGINVAERLFTKHTVKNTREFGGVTSRAIVTYAQAANVPFGAGESVHFLKGEPEDREAWGKSISCGQSVKLSDRSFSLEVAHQLALNLDRLVRDTEVITTIPRSRKVTKQEVIDRLNAGLVQDMENGHYIFSISDQQLSGVEFLFEDRYSYFLRTRLNEIEIDRSMPLEVISDIARDYYNGDYLKLLKAKVEAREDDVTEYSRPMVDFVDYVDSRSNYYLQDGKWFEFDNNYLSILRSSANQLNIITDNEVPILHEEDYRNWLDTTGNSATEWYRERYFNDRLEREYGYTNFDRTFFYEDNLPVEIADAIKDGDFVHVKIGMLQKMAYLVDQAIASLNVLIRNNREVQREGVSHRVDRFTLWMILDRASEIERLSDLRSLILLMKIAHWRSEVMKSGITPLVKISYLRD